MGLMTGSGPFGRQPAGTFNFEPPAPGRALYLEPTPKRSASSVAGETVADSRRAMLLHESGHQPSTTSRREDVRSELLEPSDRHTRCPKKGEASYYTIRVGEHVVDAGAWYYPEPIEEAPPTQGSDRVLLASGWTTGSRRTRRSFGHPRDPYHRSTCSAPAATSGSRSTASCWPRAMTAMALFESNLPPRWYLPPRGRGRRARAERHDHALPVQGNRQLLLGQAGKWRTSPTTWSGPTPTRSPEAQRIQGLAVLLQRAGRRRARRRAPGSAGVAVEPRREERSPERAGGTDARLAGSGPPPLLAPPRLQDRTEARGLLARGVRHPVPGDADGPVTAEEGVGVAVAVALERVAAAVEAVAVELDDQPLGLEQRVDEVAGDRGVDQRTGQIEALAEREKGVLEVRAGWAGRVGDERASTA